MRFSIREMLALTFLVALGMLAWRMWEGSRRDKARLSQLQNEIKSLEASVRLDNPALHQAILHMHDEFAPIQAMRDRSIARFNLLRPKYSTMAPRGADVLSIRGIPSLQIDAGSAPVIFRLLVPTERSIWLKFGVYMNDRTVRSGRSGDDFDYLTDSPFNASGPFELRLPPGDQMLKIAMGSAKEGSLPVLITLDEVVLLRSSFVSADVTGISSIHVSALSQIDLGPRGELLSFLTARMNLRTQASQTHAFALWLSDRSSSFASFPGE